jgi:poly(beta-D-mannuronate) lyase
MKKIMLGILLVSFSALWAKEISVPNVAALAGALSSAGPGDVIVLAKGNWPNAEIKVGRGGSEQSPLTIRAESPGETLLTGTSYLEINAPHVVVDGLYFTQGAIDPKQFSVIHFKSHHGTVRNTAVIDFNPPQFEDESYWAYFSGDNNVVEKCYFKGKNNMHPLLGNAIDGSRTNTIRGCYFKNIPLDDGNGREILRMWGPGKFDPKDKDGAFNLVEGNLFDGADGEGTEIISLKSNYNRVLSNTIVGSRGCLNIRQGSHNVVQGNVILGKGVEGAQGLRMSGFDNKVEGNYVSGCDWGIRIQTGEYIESALTSGYQANMKEKKSKKGEGSEVNVAKYPPVQDLVLARNVSVNNAGADLEVGFSYKKHWPENQLVLLPENCQIKDNRFIRSAGGESVIGSLPDTQPPLDKIKLSPNHYENNLLLGGTCAYAPAKSGCKEEAIPSGWSAEQELANWKVLKPEDVGPEWVVALRKAGQFAIEDDKSCYRAEPAKGEKKKKKKKKE